MAFPPQVFYADFAAPSGLRSFYVTVDVPAAPLNVDPSGPPVLREDISLDRFGMPSDLNGDGAVDDASHNDDYQAIPVVVHVRWTYANNAYEELRLSSWLWGYR